ncbi:MAG: flagellar basal body P-ring protein FlgI [Armatimonadota bacterium]
MMKQLMIAGMLLLSLAALAANDPRPEAVWKGGASAAVRVKDIARVYGARDNQLMGYGLVVGLNGTGDSNATLFTSQALANMLQRQGITVPLGKMKVKNVAAVMVTVDINPFVKSGDRIDINVSSLGDATSLQGGTLLQTPLTGADNKVYAVAQGSISLGGYSAEGAGASKTSGHPTVGRIPNGALVENEIPMPIVENGVLTFTLNYPDFTTATRMTEAINAKLAGAARARDAGTVDITVPDAYRQRLVELVATVGELTVVPDSRARVVINERTGTVVVGGNVTVSPVALAQGNLTISIDTALLVSQPGPLSGGTTVSEKVNTIETNEPQASFTMLRGNTVDELVRTLNAMKVSPRDVIAILQSLKQAGALQAELQIL